MFRRRIEPNAAHRTGDEYGRRRALDDRAHEFVTELHECGGFAYVHATISGYAGNRASFTVRTFASLDGSGTPLSLQTVLATIVAGQANQLNFALDGVVSSLSDVSSRLHPYLRPSLLS